MLSVHHGMDALASAVGQFVLSSMFGRGIDGNVAIIESKETLTGTD